MIHIFNRKELTVIQSNQRLYRLTTALSNAGIPYRVKSNRGSFFTADRYRGTPFIQQDITNSYVIYVKAVDYEYAEKAIQSAR